MSDLFSSFDLVKFQCMPADTVAFGQFPVLFRLVLTFNSVNYHG